MKWTDITSYSRDDVERVPTWWSIKLGAFVLKVGNEHIHYRDNPVWFMIFERGHEVLGVKDKFTEEEAKAKALDTALYRLEMATQAIESITK